MESLCLDIISNIARKLELFSDRRSFSFICKFIYNCVDYNDMDFIYPEKNKYLRNIIIKKNIGYGLSSPEYSKLQKIIIQSDEIPDFIPKSVSEIIVSNYCVSLPDSLFDIESVNLKNDIMLGFKSESTKKTKFLKLCSVAFFPSGLNNLITLEIHNIYCNIVSLPPNLTELKIKLCQGRIIQLNNKLEKFSVNFRKSFGLDCDFPESLIELKMSYDTDQSCLKSISQLSKLKILIVRILENTKPFCIPSSVTELDLGSTYQYNLEDIPENIEILTLSASAQKNINLNHKKLKKLTITNGCPYELLLEKTNLIELELDHVSYRFNANLPNSLQYIRMPLVCNNILKLNPGIMVSFTYNLNQYSPLHDTTIKCISTNNEIIITEYMKLTDIENYVSKKIEASKYNTIFRSFDYDPITLSDELVLEYYEISYEHKTIPAYRFDYKNMELHKTDTKLHSLASMDIIHNRVRNYGNGTIYNLLKSGCVISGSFVMDQLYLDNSNMTTKPIDVFFKNKNINCNDKNINFRFYTKEIEIFKKYNFSLDKIIMFMENDQLVIKLSHDTMNDLVTKTVRLLDLDNKPPP